MKKKEGYRILGLILFLLGLFFLLNSKVDIITSAVVGIPLASSTLSSIPSILFIIIGIILMTSSETKDLEIVVSKIAQKRLKKDKKIQSDYERYIDEIIMIRADPKSRPQERIGEFQVSPRGRGKGGIRVAWHYDKESNKLYIDDFLYHVKENKYVDNWTEKATKKKI